MRCDYIPQKTERVLAALEKFISDPLKCAVVPWKSSCFTTLNCCLISIQFFGSLVQAESSFFFNSFLYLSSSSSSSDLAEIKSGSLLVQEFESLVICALFSFLLLGGCCCVAFYYFLFREKSKIIRGAMIVQWTNRQHNNSRLICIIFSPSILEKNSPHNGWKEANDAGVDWRARGSDNNRQEKEVEYMRNKRYHYWFDLSSENELERVRSWSPWRMDRNEKKKAEKKRKKGNRIIETEKHKQQKRLENFSLHQPGSLFHSLRHFTSSSPVCCMECVVCCVFDLQLHTLISLAARGYKTHRRTETETEVNSATQPAENRRDLICET